MPTRQFEGPSIDALLEEVRSEIGTDAKIVKAQKVRRGGLFGFFARELFELTVEVPGSVRSIPRSRGAVRPRAAANGSGNGRSTGRSGGQAGTTRTGASRTSRSARTPSESSTARSGTAARFGQSRGSHSGALATGQASTGGVNDLVRRRYMPDGDGAGAATTGIDSPRPKAGVGADDEAFSPLSSTADVSELADENLVGKGSEEAATTPATAKGPADAATTPLTSDSQAMRYWAYFLVPRESERGQVPEVDSPSEGEIDALDIAHPLPSTETAAFADVIGKMAGSTDDVESPDGRASTMPEAIGTDGHGRTDEQRSPSNALEPVPPPYKSDYLDDLSLLGPEEMGMVGEAPVLPPEVIRILTRIPIAGMLPPAAQEASAWLTANRGPISGRGESTNDWGAAGLSGWHPGAAAWGDVARGVANSLTRFSPGDVFASAPFLPTGLAIIGFPAALLPTGEDSMLAARLGEPDIDLDSLDLARDLFVEALKELPPIPELPQGAGRLLAVVGDLGNARDLASKLATQRGVDPQEVVIAAPEGEYGDVPAWMVIPTEEVAAKRRPRWRDKNDVTIVAVSAPLIATNRQWARKILEALQPDLVYGVVESAHKPEDIASWAIDLGRVDCLAIEGGRATRTPAAVLACGIPVSLIDGQEADTDLWSRIVAERLAMC